jgi:CxxC-x17-CxxC domain-containing protein
MRINSRSDVRRAGFDGEPELSSVGDQIRTCRNCGAVFPFTEGEQAFYLERGYQPPAYCPDCRDLRRATARQSDLAPRGVHRQLFAAICSECGAPTEVPFQPRPGRPVYCEPCFARKRLTR